MAKFQMTRGKFAGIQACANENGIIAAAAMDQRGSLKKAIAKARGSDASNADMTAFKTAVTRVLTRHSTAILMDPEYGLPALEHKAPDAGVLLAYEKTGYDVNAGGRLPDLLGEWSVHRIKAAGGDAVKILLYYNPEDEARINEIKHAFIERIGAECKAIDIPFFLEPICYDESMDDKSLEFARIKPKYVTAYMAEFSKPQYGVDVLKVEVPVNMKYVEGTRAHSGETAYTREEAKELFRSAAAVAQKPFIYLSAGVTNEVFIETLELAAEADTPFAGVLCGRATWQEGIPVYGKQGADALEAWLEEHGVANITNLNNTLAKGAKPWWTVYGGKDQIEVI
ncbi:tagatose 1,6-diphosphate aldolase [Candidatus Viridilinea mediisalina]|uniref:tagatose-bisphosphate aldolase n=1 Tax=Candidatus Viridilinea mediisalina TaxID=2024553 RepID=A0A2A6RIF4_9CHLR|nr:tagatose 1,6-diphosphate aldolase [Candidatus Viridilinea mediisalina]PDW02665.1 tagatose-bisphosphate aldolase [Candidatus Viridilinea mediisalina]